MPKMRHSINCTGRGRRGGGSQWGGKWEGRGKNVLNEIKIKESGAEWAPGHYGALLFSLPLPLPPRFARQHFSGSTKRRRFVNGKGGESVL